MLPPMPSRPARQPNRPTFGWDNVGGPRSSGLPKPEVTSQVSMKDRSKEAGRDRRREEK